MTYSAAELAGESGVQRGWIDWLVGIGVLRPDPPGTFGFADLFRVKFVAGLLQAGFTTQQIEWAVSEGHLNLDRVDEYLPFEPGPRSDRTFSEFMSSLGPRASLLPAVYVALGLPPPDLSSRIPTDEEDRFRRFLDGWGLATADEALIRAARLIGEGTRMTTLGWAELFDEQVVGPARERLYRGDVERFPEGVRGAFATLVDLQPLMMRWLMERYLEQRIVAGVVEGLEGFFAVRDLRPPPGPVAPPAVVFIDLSGFTRITEERGDEVAVRFAVTLQRQAEAVAAAHDGRLVKLLGDGAMLRFPDARRGVEAALAVVRALAAEGSLAAHAGVHTGPVIERDLDLFGRTVNVASRIAEIARPGEVLVSEAVMEAVDDAALWFEPVERPVLKGIVEPVHVFRVAADESGSRLAGRRAGEAVRDDVEEGWTMTEAGRGAPPSIPLFAGAGAGDIDELLRIGHETSFDPGEVIFEAGDEGDGMFVVLEGEAQVDVGGRFHRLRRGDFFGEMALLAPGKRLATVRAVEPTRTVKIPSDALRSFLLDHPGVAISMMQTLVLRLREVEQRVDAWMGS